MNRFISCDWGTTTLRLSLIDLTSLQLVGKHTSTEGIAAVYGLWKNGNQPDRLKFFLEVLSKHLAAMQEGSGEEVGGVTLVVSGMISSSIGMIELPYQPLPLSADGSDFFVQEFPAIPPLPNPMFVISGVKTETDIMRGEETQLVGAYSKDRGDALYIFPGTHAKHVQVSGESIVAIQTYMTGEFFGWLTKQSIVSSNTSSPSRMSEHWNDFDRGVLHGADPSMNLLHDVFQLRVAHLFRERSLESNYSYLSGLLIGSELKEVKLDSKVVIVGDGELSEKYQRALFTLGLSTIPEIVDGVEAAIKGQYRCVIENLVE